MAKTSFNDIIFFVLILINGSHVFCADQNNEQFRQNALDKINDFWATNNPPYVAADVGEQTQRAGAKKRKLSNNNTGRDAKKAKKTNYQALIPLENDYQEPGVPSEYLKGFNISGFQVPVESAKAPVAASSNPVPDRVFCPAPDCGSNYTRISDVRAHFNLKHRDKLATYPDMAFHPSDRKFFCSICKHGFPRADTAKKCARACKKNRQQDPVASLSGYIMPSGQNNNTVNSASEDQNNNTVNIYNTTYNYYYDFNNNNIDNPGNPPSYPLIPTAKRPQ